MKNLDYLNAYRSRHPLAGMGDSYNGLFELRVFTQKFTVIASNGLGWDHVSVSHRKRAPTWAEMCAIRELFFAPEDVVVQFHPKQSEYVNVHPFCLHMWRWQGGEFPRPTTRMV